MSAEMEQELRQLLRQARTIFTDELALADVTVKGRANFVTRCDTGVQHFLQKELRKRWPEIQFLGEEEGCTLSDPTGKVFVLDPVDGTANLMHHFGHSAISLALVENGQPVLGLIYDPFRDEMFTARRGGGAFCNDRPIHASTAPGLSRSVIAVGTSLYDRQFAEANFAAFRATFDRCEDIRRTGSAALDLAYVAAGRLEGYFERNLKPWDFAAGILLVAEAGGRVSGFDGSALYPLANADVVAAAPAVFEELLEVCGSPSSLL